VIAAFGLIGLISMAALVLEGGNAYAQQRVVQNGTDAAANAGATVLARRLAGAALTDLDVAGAVTTVAGANNLDQQPAHYTDVQGRPIDLNGNVVAADAAAHVGNGSIPPGAQGVRVTGTRTFGTFLGRAIGFDSFAASADATAITGRLVGGNFLPVVYPINIVDCDTSGDLGTGEAAWQLSQPGAQGAHPVGIEYLVPLCKTGTGQFMILDLADGMSCDEEVVTPPSVAFNSFPTFVNGDQGNDCMKKITDEVNKKAGRVFLIPICDVDCSTTGGGNAQYKIVRIAAFYVDYMSYQNGGNNNVCDPVATGLVAIAGNGSSSCMAGWFVRYVTRGPVGVGPIGNSDAIGVQLIQ
jgi:hypothetical protein